MWDSLVNTKVLNSPSYAFLTLNARNALPVVLGGPPFIYMGSALSKTLLSVPDVPKYTQ